MASRPGGPGVGKTRIGGLNLFFQAIRQHRWDDTLPGTAAFYPGDTPPVPAQVSRQLAEYVMTQVESPASLDRWPNPAGPFFTGQHAFILQMMLANIYHLTAQITELSAKIDMLCELYERRQIAQLDAVPGFGVITAQDIIGEMGVDMTVFPTAGHLCSWARQAPQVKQSGGKRNGKNATGRGNPYLGGALGEAAANADRTQTFLGTKYRRLVKHMPRKKA